MSSLNDKNVRVVSDKALLSSRDVDTLYERYLPLRLALYRDFNSYLPSKASKEDLVSFINEQFVRLCYEYDVSGDMDFAGYIKTMLTLRVRHSFVDKEYRTRTKEPVGVEDDIRLQASEIGVADDDFERLRTEFMDVLMSNAQLDDLDKEIIQLLIDVKSVRVVEATLKKKYKGRLNGTDIVVRVQEVRAYVHFVIEDWLGK